MVKNLQKQINLVKNDILSRFPNCSYTILILLWDDGTTSIECRHGNNEGTKIYTSTYYNNGPAGNTKREYIPPDELPDVA